MQISFPTVHFLLSRSPHYTPLSGISLVAILLSKLRYATKTPMLGAQRVLEGYEVLLYGWSGPSSVSFLPSVQLAKAEHVVPDQAQASSALLALLQDPACEDESSLLCGPHQTVQQHHCALLISGRQAQAIKVLADVTSYTSIYRVVYMYCDG